MKKCKLEAWRLYDESFMSHQARQTKIGPDFQVTSDILTSIVNPVTLAKSKREEQRDKEVWDPNKISIE